MKSMSKKILDVRQFIGIVSYYRNMCYTRAHKLAPPTKLFSTKVKFKWTDVEHNDFMAMKKIVGCDVLIC